MFRILEDVRIILREGHMPVVVHQTWFDDEQQRALFVEAIINGRATLSLPFTGKPTTRIACARLMNESRFRLIRDEHGKRILADDADE